MPYPPETRAAVLADLLTGMSPSEVARKHGMSRTTVLMWQSQHRSTALVVQQKNQAIGEQVYGLLEDILSTLRLQIRATADETWIRQQSAGDVAILIGVECDKAIRLLGAFRPTIDADTGDDTDAA